MVNKSKEEGDDVFLEEGYLFRVVKRGLSDRMILGRDQRKREQGMGTTARRAF